MPLNEHLRDQAAAVAGLASELTKFFKDDPQVPPLKTGAAICELEKLKSRLQKLTTGLKKAVQD